MDAAFFCASEKKEQPKKQAKSINRFIITALDAENRLVFLNVLLMIIEDD